MNDLNRQRRRLNQNPERAAYGAEMLRQKASGNSADDRLSRRSRAVNRQRLLQAAALVAAVAAGWYLLTPIRSVHITADQQSTAESALHASLDRYGRRNLLINTDSIAREVTAAVPDAVSTEVNHNIFLSQLRVRVITQQPMVRWQSRGVQYVVSDYGIVLDRANDDHIDLPLIYDDANLPVEEKTQIIPRDFVSFISSMKQAADERSISIEERYVSGSTRELRLALANRPYRVIVSTQRDISSQFDELVRLEEHFKDRNQTASQYVDLRIAGRAFWR